MAASRSEKPPATLAANRYISKPSEYRSVDSSNATNPCTCNRASARYTVLGGRPRDRASSRTPQVPPGSSMIRRRTSMALSTGSRSAADMPGQRPRHSGGRFCVHAARPSSRSLLR